MSPGWTVRTAACLLTAGVVLTACGSSDDSTASVTPDEPGVEHVHGLGIDPAGGALVVATHFGAFRIAGPDEAKRIGTSYQDTMGFTVVGANNYLGSGHPDGQGMRDGQPGRLGLIESDDAGESWKSISLSGEVDFHGLAFAHCTVYGWDSSSGRFMVSADRKEWETRSTLNLAGFAVDPTDGGHIVGATPEGVVESEDGGRTWTQAQQPGLVVLSWNGKAGLWGADGSGAVWRQDKGSWQKVGTVEGEPQALLVTDADLYAATADETGATQILRSTDEAKTWGVWYQDDA